MRGSDSLGPGVLNGKYLIFHRRTPSDRRRESGLVQTAGVPVLAGHGKDSSRLPWGLLGAAPHTLERLLHFVPRAELEMLQIFQQKLCKEKTSELTCEKSM